MFLMVFQSTPEKKGWALTSSELLRPNLISGAVIMLQAFPSVIIV